jgi:hypothetical protein
MQLRDDRHVSPAVVCSDGGAHACAAAADHEDVVLSDHAFPDASGSLGF